jgi:alkyldihydroxyacetonephosphate synthase
LQPDALAFLAERIGTGTKPRDAMLAEVGWRLPAPRLPVHALVQTDAEARIRASFGQSCADWLRLRHGEVERVVDGVAFPESSAAVRELLDYAQAAGAVVIPYGGGTSVVGHLSPPDGERPVLSLNLSRLTRLQHLDKQAQLARFGAGVAGPDLEAQLRAHGYTLGHFPQSFEYSTLGGWVVTRSSGQQSLRYGRIEQLFAGGRLETPRGTLDIPTFPASSAGPDLREMVLGSEGRLGVLTEAVVRITPLPEAERFHAVFFPDWQAAQAAVQAIVQARLPLSMLRLSNELETLTMLRLAGHAKLIGYLEGYLRWRGAGERKCMLLFGVSGSRSVCKLAKREALSITARHGGLYAGTTMGEKWKANRFRSVYLRNTLWEQGYIADTVETACDWPQVETMMRSVEHTAREALAGLGARVHAYTHLSHVYAQGSSVYSTFVWPAAADFATNFSRWQTLKRAVSQTIVRCGGTISHQHGVGKDHAPYLAAEKQPLGMAALESLIARLDPQGLMNSGNLLASGHPQLAGRPLARAS